MTLHLNLPPELHERLRQESERRGEAAESVTLRILDQHLPSLADARRAAALAMLQQWMEEDAALTPEEEAANVEVLRCLDEDRPSYRKLFGDIVKDVPK